MAKSKKQYKKRTLKQWIYRYVIILFVIGILTSGVIVASNAAYRKSVTATDSVRVAKWEFTLNDQNIITLSSEPLSILSNSYFTNVSNVITADGASYNATLVPGMKGVMTYQLKNKSEVNASLTKMSITLQLDIQNPSEDMDIWTDTEWRDWIESMPIEWFITIIDKESSGVSPRTIKILVDSYLHSYSIKDGVLDGNKILETTWEIVTESSDALDFNLNTEYKVIQLNWEWVYERYASDLFYDQTNTSDDFVKSMTYTEFNQYISTNNINLSVDPTFTYLDSNSQNVTKSYSDMTFDDYLDLYTYCMSDDINDCSQLYKYFNYHEYLKWKKYYLVPDTYLPTLDDDEIRQTYYLDDIDTKFSNNDVNIYVLLECKIIQKEPR